MNISSYIKEKYKMTPNKIINVEEGETVIINNSHNVETVICTPTPTGDNLIIKKFHNEIDMAIRQHIASSPTFPNRIREVSIKNTLYAKGYNDINCENCYKFSNLLRSIQIAQTTKHQSEKINNILTDSQSPSIDN